MVPLIPRTRTFRTSSILHVEFYGFVYRDVESDGEYHRGVVLYEVFADDG